MGWATVALGQDFDSRYHGEHSSHYLFTSFGSKKQLEDKEVGVEFTSPKTEPPTPLDNQQYPYSWAGLAYEAGMKAVEASKAARAAAVEAERHMAIASASAGQAMGAQLQSQLEAAQKGLHSPIIKTLEQFCKMLKINLHFSPKKERDSHFNLQLRGFCGGLEEVIDKGLQEFAPLGGFALNLYQEPPTDYPKIPMWPPSPPPAHAGLPLTPYPLDHPEVQGELPAMPKAKEASMGPLFLQGLAVASLRIKRVKVPCAERRKHFELHNFF